MKKIAILLFSMLFASCMSVAPGTTPDDIQVAKIAAMAESITAIGAQGVLVKSPESLPNLIAVAEVLEQALAVKDAPPPTQLQQLLSGAITQFGGPYGPLIALGVNGGLAFYRQFYAANTSSVLDKQPAFKAVLRGMARGLRTGTPVVAGSADELDLVLRARR